MNNIESQPGVVPEEIPQIDKENIDEETRKETEDTNFDIKSEIGAELGDFYKVIKKKFFNPEDGWTTARLEANSTEKLAPIIRELRSKLVVGGAEKGHADTMIQELIEMAQSAESKEDFIIKVTNPGKITNPEIIKFNKFIANSLEK